MKEKETKITDNDLRNPQRFIGEGLGAPEVELRAPKELEAKVQQSAGRVHC